MTQPLAAVITVGSELCRGIRVDTNGPEIARALTAAGYRVVLAASGPDDAGQLEALIASALDRCELVMITGGLGPTHDDVTREAAAAALGRSLVADPAVLRALEPILASRGADPATGSQLARQADVIEGARVLWPDLGTAPGQVAQDAGRTLVLLPGPPREMRPMLEVFLGTVRRSAESRVLRTTGLAESTAQIAAARALEGHDGVELAVLASPSLVDILLYDDGAAAEGLDLAAETVARALGDHCYSTDGSSLAEVVVRTAAACSSSLALAESCTGGMIASALTDVPGSSVAFRGGVVAYANEAKMGLLDVSGGILDSVGAVSAECAAAMAEGARARFGSAIGLSTTGIAGPDGGSEDKPVGTVYLALATEGKTTTFLRRFSGDRDVVRTRTMVLGLDILRRHLLGLPLPGDGS